MSVIKKATGVSFLLTALLLFCAGHCVAEAIYDNGLEQTLTVAPSDSLIQIVVRFHDPVDVNILWAEIEGMSLPERREHVSLRLKERLNDAAGDAIEWIENEARMGRAEYLHPLWIAHSYVLRLQASRIPVLAEQPQVRIIVYDPPVRLEDCVDDAPDMSRDYYDPGPDPQPLTRWSIEYMGCFELWSQGYKGRGILMAVIDTGVYIEHTDLENQIWVNEDEIPNNNIDDDENGYVDDINGWNFRHDSNDISDPHGHGSKCAGVLVGNGAGRDDTTGVAPEGTLIVIRNWDSNWSSEATRGMASQYAADNGAQVISCSMSYDNQTPNEFNSIHRDTMSFLLLMGVIYTNSQGNNGNSPGPPRNINRPADCPPPWLHPDQTLAGGISAIMGIGSFTSDGLVQASSTRGPTEWYEDFYPLNYRDYPYLNGDEMGLMKPDIVAPYNTTSTYNDGGYRSFTHESCATPHAGGALGLLRSIHQQVTPAQICEAVKMSAEDGGDPGHDNVYGAGRLRVDLAHEYLDDMIDYGGVQVNVTDENSDPIFEARSELNDNEVRGWSDEDGVALMERVLPDTYILWVRANGFETGMVEEVTVTAGEITEIDVILNSADIIVEPAIVNTTLPPDEILEVLFTVDNFMPDPVDLDIELQVAGGLDWDVDDETRTRDTIGMIVPLGVAYIDSMLVIAGERDEEYRIWRFEPDGTLIDSLPQPERFTDGVHDLATNGDSLIFAGHQDVLFTLTTDWEIIDSIETTVNTVKGVAYDAQNDHFFINGSGTPLYELDNTGYVLNTYDLDITPVGLAYNPDDYYGPAVYALEMAGVGLARLSRVDLESGAVTVEADLDPAGEGLACALDIDRIHNRPYWQVVVMQLENGVRLFRRDLQSSAYDVATSVNVPPEGANVPFALYGTQCAYGAALDLELVWSLQEGGWTLTVPIIVDVVGVDDQVVVELPAKSGLADPWPNPFNPTVTLEYQLSHNGKIKLSVYNLLGQLVTVLEDNHHVAGSYRTMWDASGMASGLYFAVLETASQRYTAKMLLIR